MCDRPRTGITIGKGHTYYACGYRAACGDHPSEALGHGRWQHIREDRQHAIVDLDEACTMFDVLSDLSAALAKADPELCRRVFEAFLVWRGARPHSGLMGDPYALCDPESCEHPRNAANTAPRDLAPSGRMWPWLGPRYTSGPQRAARRGSELPP